MSRILFALLGVVVLPSAHAGVFHRCDDGSGVAIYQSTPCAAESRTIASHQFLDAPAEPAAAGPAKRSRASRERTPRSRAAPRGNDAAPRAAWACEQAGRRWAQAGPCDAPPGSRARPRQQALDRDGLCALLRDEGGAPHESASDASYRRNGLRDDNGC